MKKIKKNVGYFLLRKLYATLYFVGKCAPTHEANGFKLEKFPKPNQIAGENLYNWIGNLSKALGASNP